MEKPRKLDFDITLVVDEELSNEEIKGFLTLVRDDGPESIINPYTKTSSDGTKANIFIVHSVSDNGYKYQIPLKRNLTGGELEVIVNEWVDIFEGDFDIEASSPVLRMQDLEMFQEVEIDEDYESIAFNVENNIKHQRWMAQQISEGWRYGMKQNVEEKTSPLMRPWEQLSEKHKQYCIDNNG
jgi:hypothetical protein